MNQVLKSFHIKSAGLKRIYKEYDSYKREESKQRERIQKLENQPERDEELIKK